MGEGVADHLRLLVDLLGHEVAMVALVDQHRARRRADHLPLDPRAADIAHLDAVTGDDRPVAVLEVGHAVGEGRQRDRIRAEVHLAVAVPDRQRWAVAGADHQVVIAGEDDAERERAVQPRQHRRHRVDRFHAAAELARQQMHDGLGVGLGLELVAVGDQLVLQLAEVLDDPIVDHRYLGAHVRMGIALDRLAVRRPACMAESGQAPQRLVVQARFEVAQLALGPPPLEVAVLDGRDAGRIITPVLEPAQRLDDVTGDRLLAQNSNDATHALNLCRRCAAKTIGERQ